MRRTNLLRSAVAAGVCSLLVASSAAAKSYRAERYDVTIRLERGGAADIEETARFAFDGGPFTFVYRDLSSRKTDGIENVRAFLDGRPCPPGSGPGEVEISGVSPVRVRWHFAPTENKTHTFTVRYRALGIVRKEKDADTVVWQALPDQRSYRIDESRIRFEFPKDAEGAVSFNRSPFHFEEQPGAVTGTLRELRSKADVVVTARFRPGTLIAAPPAWEAAAAERRREFFSGVGTGAWLGLGAVAILWMWVFRMREAFAGVEPVEGLQQPHPPDSLPPATAARLTGSYGGTIGAVLGLASKGLLKIEETGKKWGSRVFALTRQPGSGPVAPHETALLDILFANGEGTVPMSKAMTRVQHKASLLKKTVDQELEAAGVLDTVRVSKRVRLITVCLLLFAFAIAGGILAAVLFSRGEPRSAGILTVASGCLALAALAGAIYGATLAPWTDAGRNVSSRWKAFRDYLRDVSKGRTPLPAPSDFERYLPYAAAFGLAGGWSKRFIKEANVAVPLWFGSLDTSDASSIAAFVAFTSYSSSSGVSGGSSGASGGGASGAG